MIQLRVLGALLLTGFLLASCKTVQKSSKEKNRAQTLLWKVEGNGLTKPTYLFGTVHILCKEDAVLSDTIRSIIASADQVYLEADMSNPLALLGLAKKMIMNGDTTLSELVSSQDYALLKEEFTRTNSALPFEIIERYQPIMASAVILQNSLSCATSGMEEVIMQETMKHKKKIKGLETLGYQMDIIGRIPYKQQAEYLLQSLKSSKDSSDRHSFNRLLKVYKEQNLEQIAAMMQEDPSMQANIEELLYVRNRNWTQKLKTLMPAQSLFVAVGAAHLPGKEGLIDLLEREGYQLVPVVNDMIKRTVL